jgi:cytochrome c peroxidase
LLGPDEDFGLEQITGNPADRYKFRSSPLRNVALQSAFFHNGALTQLDHAIITICMFSNRSVTMIRFGPVWIRTLTLRLGPIEPVLARLDPLLLNPPQFTPEEFEDLVAFVRTGLLDKRAERHKLCLLIPDKLPSGMRPLRFEGCPQPKY